MTKITSKYKFYLILIWFFIYHINVNSATSYSPILHCSQVNTSNGDVTISWIPPSDTGTIFNSYIIYASDTYSGTYTQIATISNYLQDTYTHTGANANQNSKFYYIKTNSNNSSYNTDTLQTIFLNVSSPSSTISEIQWNTTLLPQNIFSSSFNVLREYPTNNWQSIANTTTLKLYDTLIVCKELVQYQIEIDNIYNCTTTSNIDATWFEDNVVPDMPVIDSVSINPETGAAQIGWQSSQTQDTDGYLVYIKDGTSWIVVDTIYGIDSTFYSNDNSNANGHSETYRIAAIDSCGNISPMGNAHNSIHLTLDVDVCNGEIILSWNSYDSWPNNVDFYQIFVKEDSLSFQLLDTVSGNILSYTDDNLISQQNYCYYVRAINAQNNTISASSNQACLVANIPQQPFYEYIYQNTISKTNEITLNILYDTAAVIYSHKIYRTTDTLNEPFDLIETIPHSQVNNGTYTYIDEDVFTNEQSYYYKTGVIDSCGNESITSNIAKSILLTGKANSNLTNTIQWNAYKGFINGVSDYFLYRKKQGETYYTLISVIPESGVQNYEFIDDVSSFVHEQGIYRYYIEAVEWGYNQYQRQDTVKSNKKTITQYTKFFIPNAFVPESDINQNRVVKPVFVHTDFSNYQFIIYNRMGFPVFETQNPQEGWDGVVNGSPAPMGIYVYYCCFTNNKNYTIEKTGTISLIR